MNEREIFINAPVDSAPDVLEAYMERACGGDRVLRARVEGLIAAERAAGRDFLGASPLELIRPVDDDEASATMKCGEVIGSYRLLKEIGEGGFGVVYMAEQSKPVRRRVALKVIKLGMDTRQVVARFEAERQALALMDHPNIAKVLDAGATESGRPYFVMDLVRGVPITTFCDERRLDTRRRLELFRDVCAAVGHAHQKGIIHRDLKPSNVMVSLQDDRPVVKVIDFGVAKATQCDLTDKTLFTRFEQFMGTPVYMSPEQAHFSGLDIDTRSDIYSLGVLLYELLAGFTPFDPGTLATAPPDELKRIIREVDPPRPSLRVSTGGRDDVRQVAEAHCSDPGRLSRVLKGDLDWIIMKALEKDRSRRYETANALSADIARYLDGQPVEAAAPSAIYRLRKFAVRNRAALGVAAGFVGLLVTATAVSTGYALRAREAESIAEDNLRVSEDAREDAEAMLSLLTDVIRSPDPTRGGRSVTIAEVLDRAADSLEKELAGQPLRRARLQGILSYTYRALGMFHEAADLRESAVATWKEIRGPEHPDSLAAMRDLAYSYRDVDRCVEALGISERILEVRRRVQGPKDPETLHALRDLAVCQQRLGRLEAALTSYRTEVNLRREIHGPRDVETARAMEYLAICHREMGQPGEALALREGAASICRMALGLNVVETLRAMSKLAESHADVGNEEQALALRREVLDRSLDAFGPEPPCTLFAMGDLARSLRVAGRAEEAIRWCEQEVEGRRTVNGPSHPDTLAAIGNLVLTQEAAGQHDAALALRRELVDLYTARFGSGHSETLKATLHLAAACERAGLAEEALALRQALAGTPR